MHELNPVQRLHLMVRKVGYIFVIFDGVVKGDVLGAGLQKLVLSVRL